MFEKVNPRHPDKVADRIAGALVDLAYRFQENPRIAVEVLIGHGICHIIAETSTTIPLNIVALCKIPEASDCRITCVISTHTTSNIIELRYSGDRAGESTSPTGGNCAVSPNKSNEQPAPE